MFRTVIKSCQRFGRVPFIFDNSPSARTISEICNYCNTFDFLNRNDNQFEGGWQWHRGRRQSREKQPPKNEKIFLNGNLTGGSGFTLGLFGFFEKDEELSTEETIVLFLKKAILAIQRGELDYAEEHLVNALRLSHENKLEDVKTQIFDMQANLALQKHEFDRAEMLFKATAQRLVLQQHYETNSNAIVEISLKLAQIYAIRGQKEEAITGYQYCIDAQRLKIEKEDEDADEDTLMLAAWAMHSLAQLQLAVGGPASGAKNYIDKAQIEKTAILIKEAYQYASRAVGPDSEQAISIQSDLASTLAMTGDFEGALVKLHEVENIARDKHASLYPHIKVNIGNVYLQKGSFLEAERVCVDARMFAKKAKNLEAFARAEECLLASTKAQQSPV